jgi:hypothetical protein
MITHTIERGRLCNQIIRNLCVSIIAKKFNLKVSYSSFEKIKLLGIDLFVGANVYNNCIELDDNNYFNVLNRNILRSNLNPNNSYFQTKEITNFLYRYLHSIKDNIIAFNPYKERYNNNNDCFIHIRLTDASQYTPSLNYFLKTIKKIEFNKLYIATDDASHDIIKNIMDEYKLAELVDLNDVNTIQFGSTCKNIILSQGTYSAMIGYLAFFSNVYYTVLDKNHIWHGDIFSIPNWSYEKLV